MAHLVQVKAMVLSEIELSWLERVAQTDYHEIGVKYLLEEIVSGRITLWRIGGLKEGSGLVGTSYAERRDGKEIWIELLVGKGLLKEAREVREAIHALVLRSGARWLTGFAVRPGLAKLYEEVFGLHAKAKLFSEEFTI